MPIHGSLQGIESLHRADVSLPGMEPLHRANVSLPEPDMSPWRRHVSMAQISLPAREERLGRFKKAKIGPNKFFSDLTNDQRGLLIRVR